MANIKVNYDEIENVCESLATISSNVEACLDSYNSLIHNLINYPEWKGKEKGQICSRASGGYFNYFTGTSENISVYNKQLGQKSDDFRQAESQ